MEANMVKISPKNRVKNALAAEAVAKKVSNINRLRTLAGLPPLKFGTGGGSIEVAPSMRDVAIKNKKIRAANTRAIDRALWESNKVNGGKQ
jgi:hypothetical protein